MEKQVKYEFIHPALGKSQPEHCILLAEVSKLRIQFALIEQSGKRLLLLKSEFYQSETDIPVIVKGLLDSLPMDPSTFSRCKIAFYTRIFDLVPNEWLIPDERHHYLILHQPDITYQNALLNHVGSKQLCMVSALPDWVEKLRITIPNSFDIYHGAMLLFEHRFTALAKVKHPPAVHLHFLPDGLELLILNQKNIEYYNYYESNNIEELLYQVMNVLHSLEMMDTGKIICSGDPGYEKQFHDLLQTYFRKMKLSRIDMDLPRQFLKQARQLPAHEFDLLFYLLKCE